MQRLLVSFALTVVSTFVAAQGPGLPPVPTPLGNPVTAAKADLGKVLFWEEQLSSTGTIACGTCHIPAAGGSDPRSVLAPTSHPGFDGLFATADDVVGSSGVVRSLDDDTFEQDATFGIKPQVTARKSPTMINAAFAPELFWDGRAEAVFVDPVSGAVVSNSAAALESQAAGPPLSPIEMAHDNRNWLDVVARIQASEPLALAQDIPPDLDTWIAGRTYPQLFLEAFGSPNVTAVRILQAIATYQRTLISDQTPFDLFLANGPTALTNQENAGRQIFNGPGRCNLCHSGALTTDHTFRNIGLRPPFEDPGRGAITGLPQDQGSFKVPGLRNISLRAPYFHNGSAATLEEVVDFYDRGGDFAPNQSPLIQPLGLNPPQKANLIAFLRTGLLDPRVEGEQAPFDRPTLYSESLHVPELFGSATAGDGGHLPQLVALEPPIIGNQSLTLGLEDAAGSSAAILIVDPVGLVTGVDIGGLSLHLALSPGFLVAAAGVTQGVGAGSGWTSTSLALPSNPELVGLELFFQWFVVDGSAPSGFAASEGLRFGLF